jgi:hypothetical protein
MLGTYSNERFFFKIFVLRFMESTSYEHTEPIRTHIKYASTHLKYTTILHLIETLRIFWETKYVNRLANGYYNVRFDVITAVTIKNAVFRDVALCRSNVYLVCSHLLTLVPRSRIFLL